MMKIALLFATLITTSLGGSVPHRRVSPGGRIVGGEPATIEEHPYAIQLESPWGSQRCGGTILGPNTVLTAGHCCEGVTPDRLAVRVGTSSRVSGGVIYNVTKTITHPQYDSVLLSNDACVLKLSQPIEMGPGAAPIPLASEVLPGGTEVEICGWGTTQESCCLPDQLQAVKIPIIDQKKCEDIFVPLGGIEDNMFCAGVLEGGKDSCQGDSGGALVHDGELYGIISWGMGCAEPGFPGVYGRITAFRDFIDPLID